MASTASTVSWSSSWLNSLGGNLSEATKLSDRRTALVVFAQKKATKTRKVEKIDFIAEKRTGFLLLFSYILIINWVFVCLPLFGC